MAFKLQDLPYSFSALEPHIDARTMEIHFTKHHQGYVDKLNKAIAGTRWEELTLEEILKKGVKELPAEIRNNAGGHANHSHFWTTMHPDGGGNPNGELLDKLDNQFGNFESFKKTFNDVATHHFGSGWAWLALANGKFEIYSTPNQDSPLMERKTPLLGLDLWEHAYYLKHQSQRADYIEAWWNVIHWPKVAEYDDLARLGSR